MKTWEKWSFHLSAVIVSVTGLVYFYMKYLMRGEDPLSVINHPLQPQMLKLHLLAAPFLLFVTGAIFSSHISRKLKKRHLQNKVSGWTLLFSFAAMSVSGYLLPILTHPGLTRLVLIVHLAGGGFFLASYALHQVISIRLLRQCRSEPRVEDRFAA